MSWSLLSQCVDSLRGYNGLGQLTGAQTSYIWDLFGRLVTVQARR